MNYPLTNNHFIVAWGGNRIGFSEVSGLSVATESMNFIEGAFPVFSPVKMPGGYKYQNLILKRAMRKGDNEMYQWFKTLNRNQIERRDIIISLLNESHEPVVNWKISNAFPVKIEWSDLKANELTVLTETIEIAYESLSMEMF